MHGSCYLSKKIILPCIWLYMYGFCRAPSFWKDKFVLTPNVFFCLMAKLFEVIPDVKLRWQSTWHPLDIQACCNRKTVFNNVLNSDKFYLITAIFSNFCEARRASHCHSPQTTYSSKSTCCAISAQNSAMHVVVYAGRLTSQRSIVEIINW